MNPSWLPKPMELLPCKCISLPNLVGCHETLVILTTKPYPHSPVQENLRWECDRQKADQICNFNRHYAEHSGYFETRKKFKEEARSATTPMQFYDSNTGKLLFTAPVGRSMDDFLVESSAHGWPSFRDAEVRYARAQHLLLHRNASFVLKKSLSSVGKLGVRSLSSKW